MRHHRCARRLFAVGAALALWVSPALSVANPWDISLRGLGRPDRDPSAQQRFRGLSTELSFALAPRPMQPAETLGMSGFEFAFANSLTDINQNADYWTGQPGEPIFERERPKALWTPTLQFRKGLPLSTEIGVQGTYLAYSELFMLGGEFKFALHEQFFRWFPTLSVRLAAGRLMGSREIDLLTLEGDVMASLAFGVGGMAQLTPYLGYGQLAAHVNSAVLDSTPFSVSDPNDQKGGVGGSLYNFDTLVWYNNRYSRIFGGLRVNVAMIEVLFECNVGILGFVNRNVASYTIKLGFDV
jgi:hypothetical protein